MAKSERVTLVVSARDRTRAVLRRIRRGFFNLRTSAVGVFAGIAGGFGIAKMFEFATSIDAARQRLDTTAESLQALKILSEDINVPFESLVGVLQRIQSNAGAALRGDPQMIRNFEALGITFRELGTTTLDQKIGKIADAAKKAGGDLGFRDLLRDVGDTEIIRLLPLLRLGAKGIKDAIAELQQRAAITSGDAIKELAAQEAELRRAARQAERAFQETIAENLPLFTDAVKELADALRLLNKLNREEGTTENAVRKLSQSGRLGPIAQLAAGNDNASLGTVVFDIVSAIQQDSKTTNANMARLIEVTAKKKNSVIATLGL